MCSKSWPAQREPTHPSAPSSWRTSTSTTLTSQTISPGLSFSSLSLIVCPLFFLFCIYILNFLNLCLCPLLSIFSSFPLFFSFSPPLCALPWSVLPTHSLVYCNTLHHPVQLEGMCFFFCLLLFSDCTESNSMGSQPASCIIFRLCQPSAALILFYFLNETKWKMSDHDSWCFSVFLDATCGGRTGGCWVLSWTGITMPCLWPSPAVWSVCRSAAAPTTAPAKSESPVEQSSSSATVRSCTPFTASSLILCVCNKRDDWSMNMKWIDNLIMI